MLTASIITLILFYFRSFLIQNFLGYFEYAVAAMLVILGIFSLTNFKLSHSHKHNHSNIKHKHPHSHTLFSKEGHYHKQMFGIGIIHGLASNDELLTLVLVTLTLTTLPGVLLGVFIFSLGVIIGMVVYSMTINYFVRWGSERFGKLISTTTGLSSIAYGALMFAGAV